MAMRILKKIISGGQTGADRAALDMAIKFNIPHGGWITRGRRTEEGRLPDSYQLIEMTSRDYPARTRKNIIDSDGTIIIARGALTGGSDLTQSIALQAGKFLCRIDLLKQDIFESALIVQDFIASRRIEVLNVAGPRASHDSEIYFDVKTILQAVFYLDFLDEDDPVFSLAKMIRSSFVFPDSFTSIEHGLDALEQGLTLRGKTLIARSKEDQISSIYFSLLEHVLISLGLDGKNSHLFTLLAKGRNLKEYAPEDGVMDMLKILKRKLSKEFQLRVVES